MDNLVVFGPGWGGQPSSVLLNPLLGRFKGLADTKVVKYPSNGLKGLREANDALWKQFPHEILNQYRRTLYIGHSMGGLVPFNNKWGDLTNGYDGVIALGSPFKGAPGAKLGSWFSKSAEEMVPGSVALDSISRILNSVKLPLLSVTGTFDSIVPDGRFSESDFFYSRADVTEIKIPTTHVGLIYSKKVADHIFEWLEDKWK